MFALDTNTLIYFFKGLGNVGERLLATAPTEVAVPTIVVYEIETGIAKSSHPERRRLQFNQLLDIITILPFDQSAATHAATIRALLEDIGAVYRPARHPHRRNGPGAQRHARYA